MFLTIFYSLIENYYFSQLYIIFKYSDRTMNNKKINCLFLFFNIIIQNPILRNLIGDRISILDKLKTM